MFIPESNGCGAAWLDYDGDGDLDIYMVNGNGIEAIDGGARLRYLPDAANRLYRNDGDWRFTDVTEKAGVGDRGWGNGCAVGDIDNDGDPDLYVANLGQDAFYVNQGDGTFASEGVPRGAASDRWSARAAFGDIDNDGDLDLFVASYVVFDPLNPPAGGEPLMIEGVAVMWGPEAENPGINIGEANALFVNDGTGHFTESAKARGLLLEKPLCSYGAVFCDVDEDGWLDLLVANDAQANNLFMNRGGGHFAEEGEARGFARGANGRFQAGMGIAVSDIDDDGDPDLYVTNFDTEPNNLYINDGHGFFTDEGAAAGLHEPVIDRLGWGCAFLDVEFDGDLDLFVANGHVYPDGPAIGLSPWEMPDQFFLNETFPGEPPHFREVLFDPAGPMAVLKSSRGVAVADADEDGDLDLLIVDMDSRPRLLENRTRAQGHWIAVLPKGTKSNRDSYGARVRVTAGGRTRTAWVLPNQGIYSSHDPRTRFGLGGTAWVDRVEVRWPSGSVAVVEGVPVDRVLTIVEPSPAFETRGTR
jgi:hypothetical protein